MIELTKEEFFAFANKAGLTLDQAEKMRSYAQAAVLAERERCAKLAEALYCERGCEVGEEVAAAIRSQK